MTETDSVAVRSKHIVDELIEDRAPKLIHTPFWPLIKTIGYPLLGYKKAVWMVDQIAELSGTDCLNWTADYLHLNVETLGLDRVPAEGACVIVANHPGGIADGLALWDSIKAKRPDTVFFANRDALKVCPGLEERIIPVEWREDERNRSQSRELLKRAFAEFKAGKCIVVFPSGRMSEWHWKGWRLKDKVWHPTAASLARKFKAPIIPLSVRQRMPVLYYALAQINEELKDMTIFHGLMGKAGSRYRLHYGRALDAANEPGSDVELTARLRDLCEIAPWENGHP
ncbi:1-acyl-sn-glycerol-3-phosphate acyltransferase [Maricaulis sp.]|uniref:1-acyl-sn-glycerol-3-phosphate acyltransferase n=1 Tax=Maricaulis sp. TaxID=1486257 RepID=UPI00261DA9C9|nr:1-acyl-sn-glycerol-3-phosphate acyltransferase [Maricaulis sp.]